MPDNSINARNPLLIIDLFECVLEFLITSLPQPPSKEERRMLAMLARTCRTFSEPSLNLLWRRLNSLLPLVRCFSDFADEARVKTPPSPIEWLAINRYSPRIRELTLGDEPLSLQFLQCTGLVLPSLRAIRWTSTLFRTPTPKSPVDLIALLRPLLTPNIVALEVQLDSPNDPNYRSFLDNYPPLCPNLKSLKLRLDSWFEDHKAVSQALSQAICSSADWQHVELSPSIDNVVLRHLGGCPNLKTLSLTLAPQTSRPDEAFFGPEDTPFRSVSDLHLTLWVPLGFVTSFLRPCDQVFHSFAVILHTMTPNIAMELSTLLTALASPQRLHSLRSISVLEVLPRPSDISSNNRYDQPLSYETFRPLASLVHLRTLFIDINHPASLNDKEFADLVRNWPLLEELQMTWLHGEDLVASITLRGFLSLITSCRELRTISLTLDARDVPVAGTYADVCNPSITNPTTFQNCPLKHPDLVAKFLLKHLPSMRRVNVRFTPFTLGAPAADPNVNPHSQYAHLWRKVNRHMGYPVNRTLCGPRRDHRQLEVAADYCTICRASHGHLNETKFPLCNVVRRVTRHTRASPQATIPSSRPMTK